VSLPQTLYSWRAQVSKTSLAAAATPAPAPGVAYRRAQPWT